MTNETLQSYLANFAALIRASSPKYARRGETRGRAPHKPLLLLTVLDLAAEGQLTRNLIQLTQDLEERFDVYWITVMGPDHHTKVDYPYYHLTSEGFWHLVPRMGDETFVAQLSGPPPRHELSEKVLGVRLDEALYRLVFKKTSREARRKILLETYFDGNALRDLRKLSREPSAPSRPRTHYDKLVRDLIPQIIRDSGREYEVEIMDERAFRAALLEKLVEEAQEAVTADPDELLKELADVAEVLDTILSAHGIPQEALAAKRQARRAERGGFQKRLKLVWPES